MLRIRSSLLGRSTGRVLRLLPPGLRRRARTLSALLVLGALLELVGLASLIPLFTAILGTDATQVAYLEPLHALLGSPGERAFVLLLCGAVVAFFALKAVVSLAIARAQARFSFDVYEHVASALHASLYEESLEAVRARNSTEIVRDIDSASSRFAQELVLPLVQGWSELFVLVAVTMAVVCFEPLGALLLAAVIVPTFLLFYRRVKARLRALNEATYALSARKNEHLFESVFGFAELKVAGREDAIQARYRDEVRRFSDASIQQHVLRVAPFRLIEVVVVLALCALVAYGLFRFDSRAELVTLIGVFALAAYRTIPSANRLLSATLAVRAHEHLFDVVEPATEILARPRATPAPLAFEREIRLEGVSFAYPDAPAPVLRDVTLAIPRGACIGIIGRSGAGKSTLLKVILRFLKETSGRILVDDIEVDATRVLAWRSLIGYVPQDPFVLDDTVAQNVALRAEPIDEARVEQALERAGLAGFVATLENGVQTRVGERGARLSGGQRQRLGIARALYGGASLLLLDEATSALDAATETEITDAIRALKETSVTILVVAHRLTTLRHSDEVVELVEGRIASVRPYDEVVAAAGAPGGATHG